jgi:hypothetical protein
MNPPSREKFLRWITEMGLDVGQLMALWNIATDMKRDGLDQRYVMERWEELKGVPVVTSRSRDWQAAQARHEALRDARVAEA